ncbi:probable endopolygalacturonase B [Agrilus planipennis]|uniref:endo-polygalacturonase n=1 Tax=Agrilus planipennis TaxID=224129 RepID=A0A1W4WVG2_AGRPL|nr:probable endopolygalacturonase B [Agrilus planipennis]XP_018324498.1 probable endopolygalacturonase B [Agrilus planipennis]
MRSFLLRLSIILLTQSYNLSESATSECTLTGNSLENLTSILTTCQEISIANLQVPAGETLALYAQNDSIITFEGCITFGYKEMTNFLVIIHGNNITVIGAPGHLIDGDGARWWDTFGSNGGRKKPRFIQFQLKNSLVKGLNVKNSPQHCFSIFESENVILTDITFDCLDGDTQGGHNTDAFGTGYSKNVTITNSTVYNQDDCFGINSGSGHVFTNNFCYGGHGISIGSVGGRENNVVENILIKNNTVVNSENGIRIKTNYNTTGIVRNITFEDITIENITTYGFLVRGDYRNGGSAGKPSPGFELSHLTFRNIHGTVQSGGTNVYIFLADGVASNWTVENIKIVGGQRRVRCSGIPSDSNFSCEEQNGGTKQYL